MDRDYRQEARDGRSSPSGGGTGPGFDPGTGPRRLRPATPEGGKARRVRTVWIAGTLLLAGLALIDIGAGRAGIGPGSPQFRDILWQIRFPRVLTALLAGAGLSLAGLQMQAVFRNPLADPHIMGVSGGAGFGAAIATLLLTGVSGTLAGLSMAAAAFAGAVFSTLLILLVSRRLRSGSALLIFGVMAGFIFNALTSVLEYTAGQESLKLFYSWSAGSFSGTRTGQITLLALALLLGSLGALGNAKGLDIILFGDDYARLTGAPADRIRFRALIGACILTGTVTAFCGPLGFVGIVSPHIARRLCGSARHARVLYPTLCVGAVLSLAADLVSQSARVPLPVGSTLALFGIPIILLILLSRKNDLS